MAGLLGKRARRICAGFATRHWRGMFVLALSIAALPLAARPGGDTVPILDVGVGGKALALGGAFTAISDDATALVYNPAGLVAIDGDELTMTYTGMGGFFWNMGYAGYARNFGDLLTLGVGAKFLFSGSQDNYASTSDFSTFNENQYMFLVGAALDLPLAIKLGTTLKLALRDFSWSDNGSDQTRNASFFNADIGLLWPASEAFSLGLRIENVIPSVDFGLGSAKEPVATKIVFGVALHLFDKRLTVATDFDWVTGIGEFDYHLGLGYEILSGFTLYAGLDGGLFDFGLGFAISDFTFYSSMQIDSAVEPSARFAIHYRIGKDKQEYRSIEKQMDHLTKGIDQFAKGEYAGARKHFAAVLQENPLQESARNLDRIAETRLRDGDWKTDNDKRQIAQLLDRAEELYKSGELALARKAATGVLDLDPLEWKARDLVEKIDRSLDEAVDRGYRDGVNLFIKNDLAGAQKRLAGVLDLRPAHREARDLSERIKRLQKDNWERTENARQRTDNASIYRKRGMELFNRKIYVDAIESFKLSLGYEDSVTTRYYLDLAKKRYDDLAISGQSMTRSAEFLGLARDRLKEKKVREAITLLEKALNYWPQNDEAEKTMQAARDSLATLVQKPFNEAVAFYKDGKYVEALRKWKEALVIDPEHEASKKYVADTSREMQERARYNVQLAETHVRRGGDQDLLEALKYYRIAAELDPANEQARHGQSTTAARFASLAKTLFDEGFDALKSGVPERLATAIDRFERYLLIKPEDKQGQQFFEEAKKKRASQQSYLTLQQRRAEGVDFFNNREYGRAAEKFREGLKLEPNNRELAEYLKKCEDRIKLTDSRNRVLEAFNVGIRHFKKRDYDNAIATWKKIGGMDDATPGDRQMVEGYIRTAEEVRVYNQNRYFILGEESAKAGRLLQAREALAEALLINKYHEKARTLLVDVNDRIKAFAVTETRKGEQLFEKGDYTNAVKTLENAKLHDPADDRLQNRLDEAADNLRLFNEGLAAEQQNKNSDAIVVFQKVVQNNPQDKRTKERITALGRKLSDQTDQMIKQAEKQIEAKQYNDALLALQLVLEIVNYKESQQARDVTKRYATELQTKARDLMSRALADAWAQGMRFYAAGNYEGALPFFELAWGWDRNYRELRNVRRIAINKIAEVRAAAAKQNEAQIQQLLYTGMSLYQQGNFQGAINTWSQILAISPGHSAALSYIARARFKLGQ